MSGLYHRDIVDGVPVYWVDMPPFWATLFFRVGIADEQYLNRGITHLAEHMALDQFFSSHFTFNGTTGYEVTSFQFQGNREHFGGFVNNLSSYFSNPDFDHFDREKQILRTEGINRDVGMAARLFRTRFGHRGPGLLASVEWGLRWLGPTHTKRWGLDNFNKSNLVVAMSGPPPPGLAFALPEGERKIVPRPEVARPGRVQQTYGHGGVAFSGLIPREYAHEGLLLAVREMAIDRLRRDTGDLYDLSIEYFRVDANRAIATFIAACSDTQAPSIIRTVDDAIAEIADSGVPEDIYQRIVGRVNLEQPSPTDLARGEMVANAYSEIVDWKLDSLEERMARRVPDRTEIQELAVPLSESLQVMHPETVGNDTDRFPVSGTEPLNATHVATWTGGAENSWPGPGSQMVFNSEILQTEIPDNPTIRIPFDSVAAVIINKRYENWVVGEDGSELRFWQGDWQPEQPDYWDRLWDYLPRNRYISGFDEQFTTQPHGLRIDRNY